MELCEVNLDEIIEKILKINVRFDKKNVLKLEEIKWIVETADKLFLLEPSLIELEPPVIVCGDIFGDLESIQRIFKIGGDPANTKYLFLGNYIDKRKNGIESLCLLYAYKIKYPNTFFLLRGNHECAQITRIYGFYDECKVKYSVKLWKIIIKCFDSLPLAAIISNKIFCVHGGLSPEMKSVEDINGIKRPVVVDDYGIVCDLLWSEPDINVKYWDEIPKGYSFIYGRKTIKKFLRRHDFDFICKSNVCYLEGYEIIGNGQLISLFSSQSTFEDNIYGAIMRIDEFLNYNFYRLTLQNPSISKHSIFSES